MLDNHETFNLIIKMLAFRILLIIALHHNCLVKLDVSNVFLFKKVNGNHFYGSTSGFSRPSLSSSCLPFKKNQLMVLSKCLGHDLSSSQITCRPLILNLKLLIRLFSFSTISMLLSNLQRKFSLCNFGLFSYFFGQSSN